MIDFVTGRGRRVHMRDPNHANQTVCGVRYDVMVPHNAVDRQDMCHNCLATYAWSQAGGDRLVPLLPRTPGGIPSTGDPAAVPVPVG